MNYNEDKLLEFATGIAARAWVESEILDQEHGRTTATEKRLDMHGKCLRELAEFARMVERVDDREFDAWNARAVVDAIGRIHSAIFQSGDFYCRFWKKDDDEESEECNETPPVHARELELCTDGVKISLVGRGHYTQKGETLADDLVNTAAEICHLGAACWEDWDGGVTWTKYEINREE